MSVTKYSRLNPDRYRNQNSEEYRGFWRGEPVSFRREFRGHVFTDEECEALCNGQFIEVHNIQGSRGIYAVQGHLARVDRGFMSLVKFDVLDIVPNNPNYQFGMPLYDLHPKPYESGTEDVDLTDDDLNGIYFGDMSDVIRDAEAYREQKQMAEAASLAALEDTDDSYESSDYLNIADDNPYGDFEENELFEMPAEDLPDNTVADFSDEDYDDFDDDDVMLDDIFDEKD